MPDMSTFLSNEGTSLTGLSPEEIRGVSAGRIGREQMMGQMINLLAGQRGREAGIAAQETATRLTEAKRKQIEEPEMTEIADAEGNKFQIPQKDIISGMSLMNQINRNRKLNLLTDRQIAEVETKIPITVKGETYQVSPTHYKSIAEAGRLRKKDEERTAALAKYEGKRIEDLGDMELTDFAVLGGTGGVAALANKVRAFGDALTPNEEMRATNMQHQLGNILLGTEPSKEDPDPSNIETYNTLASKLRSNHMVLKIPKERTLWWDTTQAVTVALPPGVTADMVYAEAAKQGRAVDEIIQDIYNKAQER